MCETMLTKICSRCGRRYSGAFCPACESKRQRTYDRTERNRERASFYKSKEWQTLTAMCKARCHGLDLFEMERTGKIVMGRLSHHIVPVEEDMTHALDINNLIWVSDHSHRLIHEAYSRSDEEKKKMQAFLRRIIDFRQSKTD